MRCAVLLCLLWSLVEIHSQTVPQPGVDITLSHTAPLYAGTSLTLTCTVTLDPNVDNGQSVMTEWSGPRDISGERYAVTAASGSWGTFTGSLTISPLAGRDDGTYTCTGTVTGGTNVQQPTASDDVTLNITSLPAPVVTISFSGDSTAGQDYSMQCSASVVAGLVVLPDLKIVFPNSTEISVMSSTFLEYKFSPLRTSSRGRYTCTATLNIPLASIMHLQNSGRETVTVAIPAPYTTFLGQLVTQVDQHSTTLYSGTVFTLICVVVLVTEVDTTVTVLTSWYKDGSMISNTNRILVESMASQNMFHKNVYESILVFNPLSNVESEGDDGNYTCSAQVQDDDYITGSATNITETLGVDDLGQPLVTVRSEGSSTAGESFTVECIVETVEGVRSKDISLQWMGPDGSEPSGDNIDIGELTTDGIMTTGRLLFSPLYTSDRGQYTCTGRIRADSVEVDVSSSSSMIINVTTPFPPSAVSVSQNGLDSVLVSWTPPSGEPDVTGYIIYYQQDGAQRLSVNTEATATTATITGLIAGATYSITMVANYSILPSTETEAQTLIIESIIISLTSSPSSTIMAGDTVTLTCSVTLPTGVTGTPDFQWEGPGVTPTPAAPTTSGQMTSSDLTLSDIVTSKAGQYTCNATLSESTASITTLNVTVQIPVLTPSITVSNNDTLYAGTTLSLTCNYTLSTSVDTAVLIAVTWVVDGAAVDSSPGQISIVGATLSFSPLATSDTGNYTCELTVTAPHQTHVTVQEPVQITEKDIIVEVPQPSVDITISHTAPLYAGTSLTLTCTVTLDPNVDNGESVMTEWSGPTDIFGESYSVAAASGSGSTYTGSLTISPLADRDYGTYTCTGTVTGGTNVQQPTASDDLTLHITSLPAPVVTTSFSGDSTAGQGYSMQCSASVVSGLVVLPDLKIVFPNSTEISVMSSTFLEYKFSPLRTSDGGQYTCTATLNIPLAGIMHLQNSGMETVTVAIPAPSITFFGQLVTQVDQHSTTLYSGTVFSLICVVVLVTEVDTTVTVLTSWYKDGSIISSTNRISVDSMASQNIFLVNVYESSVVFNPLSNMESGGDGGNYTCSAQVQDDDYITGSATNITETLEVDNLGQPLVTVRSEGSSTVGESLTVECIVETVEGVRSEDISIQWMGPDGSEPSGDNIEIGELTTDGIMTTGRLLFSPLYTSDRGQYTCTGRIRADSVEVDVSSSSSLIINVTMVGPPEGGYNMSDDVNSFNVSAPSAPSAVSVSQNGLESVLVSWTPPSGEADLTGYIIYYQQNGGQRLSVNAEATVTTANITGLIAGATYSITMVATYSTLPNTETEAHTVTIEPVIISLTSSPSSTIMAGDTITLACSITLPAGVNDTPDFQWEGPGVTPTPAAPTISGRMTSSDLTLNDIATSQAGQYTCTTTLSKSTVSTTTLNVTVQIPVLTPFITVSNNDTLYAGITLSLTCDYTLSISVDTPVLIAVTWMVDGAAVDSSPGQISTFGATLSFSPLATSDTGSYICELTLIPRQTHVTVQGPVQSSQEDITVEIPQPGVDITLSHTAPLYAGTSLTLTCTVTLDPNVDNGESVMTEWSGPREISGESYSVTASSGSRSTYTGSLTISPLDDQDDGTYTCTGTVTGGTNVQQATASDDVIIAVIALPAPNVSISLVSGSPTAGQTYTLTCSVQVVPHLVVEPSIVWIRQDGTQVNASSGYTLQLNFNPLMAMDFINYTCRASVDITGTLSVSGEHSIDLVVTTPLGAPVMFEAVPGQRQVVFSWSPPLMAQHDGVITSYTLSCSPSPSSLPQSPSQSGPLPVAGFSPDTSYSCSVVANNHQISGPPSSTTFTTLQDYSFFQLHFSGIHATCSELVITERDEKLEDITSALLEELTGSCNDCGITSDIIDRQSFSCYPESPTHVTYRARLEGTSETDSGSLISLIEEWVSDGTSIIVTGVLMKVDSECSMAISSLSEGECVITTLLPTTSGSTSIITDFTPFSEDTTSTHSQSSSNNTIAIIGGVVAVVIILIISVTVAIIAVVALIVKSHRGVVFIKKAEEHAKTLLPGSPSYAVKGVAITSTSNIPYEMTKEREEAGACHEYETVNMPPETTPLDLKGIYKIPYLPPIPAIPLPVATPPSWKVGMAGEEEEELYENIPGDQ